MDFELGFSNATSVTQIAEIGDTQLCEDSLIEPSPVCSDLAEPWVTDRRRAVAGLVAEEAGATVEAERQ